MPRTALVTGEAALREVAGRIGPVDVLVNSAGIVGANKPLLETTTQEWQRVLDVNLLGIVNAMRIFVPGLRDRGWGRVVNLASMAGKDGNPSLSIYPASKAAVIALTKSAGSAAAAPPTELALLRWRGPGRGRPRGLHRGCRSRRRR